MYKTLLEKNGYAENIDFVIINGVITALTKIKPVNHPIIHPEIPEERNTAGEICFLKVPAWSEDNFVNEPYTVVLPSYINLVALEGKSSRDKCQKALDIIYGFNKAKTSVQILQMLTDFAQINELLKNNWTSAASIQIQAVTVDGVLITQEMKDMLIGVLS